MRFGVSGKMDIKNFVILKVLLVIFQVQFALGIVVKSDGLVGSSEIVDGTRSKPGTFQYMVALTSDSGDGSNVTIFLCGGVLVSPWAVMTAASCIHFVYDPVTETLDSSLRAVVGTKQWNSGGDRYQISHNVSYPGRNDTTNDFGVLFTKTCVKISKLVWPIPIDFDYVGTGVPTKMAGWGFTKDDPDNGNFSDDLIQLKTITLSEDDCSSKADQVSTSYNIYPELEICVFNSSKSGSCYGDDGGPLVRTDRGTLVGIVTWGFPCAIGGPDIAVRFSAFKEWIITTVYGKEFLNRRIEDWKTIRSFNRNRTMCLLLDADSDCKTLQ